MHSHVSTQKSLFIHFSHINFISSNHIVKGIKFCTPNFLSFHWVIWTKWKTLTNGSVIHMWLSVLCLYFSFLFFLHLNETNTGTLFMIAPREIFGETWKFSCWTQHFGHSCQKTQKDLVSNTEPGLICWSMILLWCLFLSHKFFDCFVKSYH